MTLHQQARAAAMEPDVLDTPIARHVWETRYRAGEAEASIEATWRRVTLALAAVEPVEQADWKGRFVDIMQGLQFLRAAASRPVRGPAAMSRCSTASSWA